VDMAKLKHEVLARYYDVHGLPPRARVFGSVAAMGPVGCATAPVSNWLLRSAPVRWALDRGLGIDARRRLPAFARRRFTRWFAAHRRASAARGTPARAAGVPGTLTNDGRVLLLVDTFTEYYYPSIGQAAVRLLEAAGCRVELAATQCCGRPMISNGMLREARALAEANVARLRPYADDGVPIVGLEPSCAVTFKDEYPDLAPGPAADAVARQTYLFEEFLAALQGAGTRLPYARQERHVLLHGHCHQKAMVGIGPSVAVLASVPGWRVEPIDSGCCGMAGSFGVEREHYAVSLAMGERVLFKALRGAPADAVVVAAGASCRQQIAHGTGRRAVHPAEALAGALAQTNG
jgi:Fe-S oxidoreductase